MPDRPDTAALHATLVNRSTDKHAGRVASRAARSLGLSVAEYQQAMDENAQHAAKLRHPSNTGPALNLIQGGRDA